MALSTCRECGAQVNTEAATCPSCGVSNPTGGKPRKKRIGCVGWSLLLFGGLTLLYLLVLQLLPDPIAEGLKDVEASRVTATHEVIADSMVWCPTRATFQDAKNGLMEDALLARLECGFFAEGDSVRLIRSDGPDARVTVIPAEGSEPTVDDNVWTSSSGLEELLADSR